ncbi:acyltransferase [Gracilibacillus caseinilyticus]|uniref:Acyltransferase n=1 Tax=Gracilibacillus caseinilyticus TaxID=2932256 RepID=A0ABY4F245_9BACI|nr:acyltransferase [Gracilibacillus caseinilyticus]UOQ50285.1 acyltransferase [Gracilibacillus caseinilyticus]
MQKRIDSIYFLRLFAMLLVVLVHATGTYYSTLPMDGEAFAKYHFFNRFIRIEAGIFIMLTALVFFYNFSNKNLSVSLFIDYLKKRVLYILVPYIVWAVFYEFYARLTIHRELSIMDILSRILQGDSYYQLHFIFLIVQFYLVFPIFITLAKKLSFFRKYMWLIGIIVEILYYYLNDKYDLVSFNLFLNMLGPYFMGAWIGMHYQAIKSNIHKRLPTILFGIVFVVAGSALALLHYYVYTVQSFYLKGIYYKLIETTFLVGGSYFFFRVAELLLKISSASVMNITRNIALYSFGFYLLHPFVLKEVARFIPVHNNYLFHIEVLGRYVFTVIFCYFIIYFIHRFFPFAGLLFGKLPKKAARLPLLNQRKSAS